MSKLVGTVIGYKDYNKLREVRDNSACRYNYIVHFDNGIIIDFWHEAIRKAVGKCPKYLLVKSPHIQ